VWRGTAGERTDDQFIACYTWRHSSISSMQRRRRRRERHLSARFVYTQTGRSGRLTVRLTGHARVGRSGRHWCLASCPSTPLDWAARVWWVACPRRRRRRRLTDSGLPAHRRYASNDVENIRPSRCVRAETWAWARVGCSVRPAFHLHRSTTVPRRSHTSLPLALRLFRKHNLLAVHQR